ncbi:MAG TPA: ABC transporter permease subunit [Actinomycetota bacterium]|nr:ABC transporter permease subunit [Actinomycetota bacterium]
MSEAAVERKAAPPLWRNIRVLRGFGQAVFIVAVVFAFRELFLNLQFGLDRQGQELNFDFLRQRAGFSIKEGISYSPNQSFVRALQVGLSNTLRVAVVGVILASIFGLIMGVARLSTNWLIRKLAQVYVEAVRNTPLAVQLVFWYVAVVLALPAGTTGGLSIWNVAFISNRASVVPWVRAEDTFGVWAVFLVIAIVAAVGVRYWRKRVSERTAQPPRRFLWTLGTFVVIAAVGYVVAGNPVRFDVPKFVDRTYEGGARLSPEYTALLLALVVYTGAFIAEIVRGSILAVSKGQKEAAEALGLTPRQQLRLVVLPQALRIAIPPINSQYLNLTKNSSLGLLIGFPEIVSVGRTISNQAGGATQVLLIWMATFLTLSLTISFFMNLLNRAVTRRGDRR